MSTSNDELARRRARLNPEQQAALARRLKGAAGAEMANSPATQAVPVRTCPHAGPLSFAQQRQWFYWQLDPASTAYHLGGALHFEGVLDLAALKGAFEALVARHEGLRTVLRERDDGTVEQIVQAAMPLDIPLLDLGHLPPDAREAGAASEVARQQALPFDLRAGPMLRVAVVRLSGQRHTVVVVMHHAVTDAWSKQIVLGEFVANYTGLVRDGQLPARPPLTRHLIDHARAQQAWLGSPEQARQLAYWRDRLACAGGDGEHPVLRLPADGPREFSGPRRALELSCAVPADLADRLRRRAQAQGGTLFTALLVAFQAMLQRFSGLDDIRVGVPTAGRHQLDSEGVVGLFVNTLVIRNRLDGRTPLATVLAQAGEALAEAQAHQDLPFDQLVDALQPGRTTGHHPLFQVMCNHLREDHRVLDGLPGLRLLRYELADQHAKFDLTLNTVEDPHGRLEGRFGWPEGLFEVDTVQRFARAWLALLTALTDEPARAVAEVVLDDAEGQALLAAWRTGPSLTAADRGHDAIVLDRIEALAAVSPSALAVSCGADSLSRADLQARTNRLAHHLMSLGVALESPVALALPRSIDLIVVWLAVWKAGGACVPLDMAQPTPRLRQMLEGTACRWVLAHGAAPSGLMDGGGEAGPAWIALDGLSLDHLPATRPHRNPASQHAATLAHVIHTSGSTGRPKAVGVSHGALAHYVTAVSDRLGFAARGDGSDGGAPGAMAMVSTPAADLGHTTLFGALCAGWPLHLAEPGHELDALRLAEGLRRDGVAVLKIVPSHLQALMQALALAGRDPAEALPTHTLVLGGEATPWALLTRLRALRPGLRIVNHYGPTEATVGVLTQDAAEAHAPAATLPLGRPLAGITAHVLDAHLDPVPPGCEGELYLAGPSLARGYLGQGGLTAWRFVADPFGAPGGRLYRTGDRVRWRTGGQLEYLGRTDHQLKVRGVRVEPGEIEAVLAAQPGVAQALVVASPASPAGGEGAVPRLLAYAVPDEAHAALDGVALRAALARALPDALVPAAVVVLPTWPLNANGKIDRRALPPPPDSPPTAHEAPQGELETALAALWSEVLSDGAPGIDNTALAIGRHDRFFDLGGHSLGLMRVQAAVHKRLGVQLPLRSYVANPTLADLALEMASVRGCAAADEDAALRDMAALLESLEN
jgi:amino acid adenylation domain-containing protein